MMVRSAPRELNKTYLTELFTSFCLFSKLPSESEMQKRQVQFIGVRLFDSRAFFVTAIKNILFLLSFSLIIGNYTTYMYTDCISLSLHRR